MAATTNRPNLTPSFCFNETAVRDFLRISRGAVDDTISQNLNSLLTPSKQPFNPSSTSERQFGPRTRRQVPADSCQTFKNGVLFPSWQTRSDVLNYCAGVATSPDPDDPDHILRVEEDARARERVVDERLDPYSGRYFPRQERTERLAGLIRNERAVEGIVRSRTWGIVTERCEEAAGQSRDTGWQTALDEWRQSAERERSR